MSTPASENGDETPPLPLNSTVSTPSDSRFAYKALPKFDPIHYRIWASNTRDAFAERGWDHLLREPHPSDPETQP